MWKEFSIDKYAPRDDKAAMKAKSAPAVRKTKPRTKPRITVPDPFYMTLRDELKKPTKTKGLEGLSFTLIFLLCLNNRIICCCCYSIF